MSDDDDDFDDDGDDDLDPDGIWTCWCGAEGHYDELFDDTGLEQSCGGTGTVNCYCGGDFCVCHHHGSTECPGCEECQDDFDEDDEIPY